ncbi:MAG: hypothetical protein LUC41_04260 [Clostridiales bacterium]|nr:hypothetical protein [Clostridiales bacterium]
MAYRLNDKVWFVRSKHIVTEAEIIDIDGEFYTIRFPGNIGWAATKLRRSRLFPTEQEAQVSAGIREAPRKYPRSPHLMYFDI